MKKNKHYFVNLLDSLMSNFTGSSEHSGIPTKKISGDNSSTGGSRSRYAALRDRRAKVARSKSTAVVGFMGYNNDEGNLLRGIDNCLGVWYKKGVIAYASASVGLLISSFLVYNITKKL